MLEAGADLFASAYATEQSRSFRSKMIITGITP